VFTSGRYCIVKAGDFIGSLCDFACCGLCTPAHDFYRKTFSEKNRDLYGSKDSIKPVMAIFLFLILSSYATEVIGIHAPFGAL
jgi:hypothetical protein